MFQVVKVRIYPNTEQQESLAKIFGCVRWLWNHHLALINQTYLETSKGLSCFELNNRLPELKREFAWLSECYSQALQQVNLHLSRAFTNFFEKRASFPTFKSKRNRQSAHYPQHVQMDADSKALKVPKLGWIKAKIHRLFDGKLKGVTLSRASSGKYFASLLFDTDQEPPAVSSEVAEAVAQGGYRQHSTAIGIDLNLTDFAVMSDGKKVTHPKNWYRHEPNLARKQKKLAHKQKGSRGWWKAKRLVARIHERITNARNDFLHKLSRHLVNENQVICVEDLAVKNLVRNHCLAKAISDSGWSRFVTMLAYKCKNAGKILIKIDRFFPSSKLCHKCQYQLANLPLTVRQWECPSCQTLHDRDMNAALNIRDEGLQVLALGTRATADGGDVRPKRGHTSSRRQSPLISEAHPL